MRNSSALNDFLHKLSNTVSCDLRTDRYSRILYSTDASIYQVMPHGVLIPKSDEDIQAAIELSAEFRIPTLARAGGSSLAGQTVNEALVIDTSRHLDGVLELNQAEKWVRVQPGIVLDELNLYLRQYNLQFGPDPASSNRACMGGIVANNSTGSHSILYGMTADHVLEARTILSDGSIQEFAPLSEDSLAQHCKRSGMAGAIYRGVSTLVQQNRDVILKHTPRHWRRCGGYNLDRFIEGATFQYKPDSRFNIARLMCGSEGTLGFITELKLNLVDCPKMTALAIVHFESLPKALSSVPAILEVEPAAVELLDNLGLRMCREVPQYARLLKTFVQGTPHCLLLTEFYGTSETELRSKIARLETHLKGAGVKCTISHAIEPKLQNNVWTVRKVGLGLLMSVKGDHKPIPFIEDSAVPVEHLAEYVTQVETFCNDLGTDVAYYAHASAGCIHIRPLVNTKKAEEIAKLPEIGSFAMELVKGYGGALSSEHGDGRTRSWLNEQFFGPELFSLFREIKNLFDPDNLFNPGNIVGNPAMQENLRFGETYTTQEIREYISFADDRGFNRAVEMCNGAGICRKKTTGVMCPSFMATREEEHSTRGRANALRAALSGLLPAEDLTGQRMYEVMDLCVSCKACKAECPSSVDMAKIKLEFLAQYNKKHGVSLRSRIFGNIATLNKMSSGAVAPMANWILSNAVSKWKLEKFLGISSKRALPTFARQPFGQWFKNRRTVSGENPKQVVLFNDTFNTYNDPRIAIAAVEVLEKAGFEVILPGIKCCGRPLISKGLVNGARSAAKDTIERLAPFADKGLPIVGLEPSCLLAMRDEYYYLLSDDRVAKVADSCFTFEEFLVKLSGQGELQINPERTGSRKALLHSHCHEKALVGTGPSAKVLELAGCQVNVIDSSCCGMAGSFGYEAEHYEISKLMAERTLLPSVRSADDDTLIVATGTSCRHQIEHFSQRQVLHPAEVVRQVIAE